MNINYKQKYLKYKTKYNDLKNIQEGGIETGELRAYFLTEEQLKFCIENQENKKQQNIAHEYIKNNNKIIIKFAEKNLCDNKIVKLKENTKKMEDITEQQMHQLEPASAPTPEQQINVPLRRHIVPGVAALKRWQDQREQEKKVTKNTIDAAKCNHLIKENQNLMQQYNKLEDAMYDGQNMRCNFNLCGINLYNKLLFKLENIYPYCIQNNKFIYSININNKKLEKKDLNKNFDYTDTSLITEVINKLKEDDKFKTSEFKYIVIVRHYRTIPNIFIGLYKKKDKKKDKDKDTFKYITPSSNWDIFKQKLNLTQQQ
jgi:hypothetical protein